MEVLTVKGEFIPEPFNPSSSLFEYQLMVKLRFFLFLPVSCHLYSEDGGDLVAMHEAL